MQENETCRVEFSASVLKKYFVHASFYIGCTRAQKEILISFHFDQETLLGNLCYYRDLPLKTSTTVTWF